MNYSEYDFNITITDAKRRIRNASRFSYLETPRPNYGLLLLVQGRMDYIIDDHVLSLNPHDVILLPKGSKYDVRMYTEESTVEDLLINFDLITEGNYEFPIKPFSVVPDTNKTLLHIMESLITNYQAGDFKCLLSKSYFYLCLYEMINYTKKDNNYELINNAKKLLTDPKNYSVEEIAQMLMISNSGLRRKFKEWEGVSLIEFRLQKKLEEAKLLLASTDLPLKEIAQICNFYDTAYFYKVFHKNVGMTPKQYRALHYSDL